MQLQFPDETIYWAMGKLLPLFRLRGAPKSMPEREAYAAAILRIAHPDLVRLRFADPLSEPTEAAIGDALQKSTADMDATAPNPLDWLVATLVDESQWFPEAVTARAIFIEKFPCADGKKTLEAER